MAKWLPPFFSFGCITYKQPDDNSQTKRPSDPPEITAENLENVRESILDFTTHFGEINPDMLYLCRRGQSGPERAVFASFPSVRSEAMKKIVKSSIFLRKNK